jgi:hypothetical protein
MAPPAQQIIVLQYADIWSPAVAPAPPDGWRRPELRVEEFMDCLLTPEFFDRLVVWNTRFLRNRRQFGIGRKQEFVPLTLNEAGAKWLAVQKACYSHGHLSILCLPKNTDAFRTRILASGYYADGVQVALGGYPVADAERRLLAFFAEGDVIFTFSHDADSLYEVRCVGKSQ